MNILTIYTPDYDDGENMVNNGMSGKAFLDVDGMAGIPFCSITSAISHIVENDVQIDQIEFDYPSKDGQKFKKFRIDGNPDRQW